MLNDEHGVALVDKTAQHREQTADIFKVQTRRRFIEQVDGVTGGPLRKFSRQLHSLGLTTRQRRRRLAEPNITEPHIHQRLQVAGDRGLITEELNSLSYRHIQHIGDVLAFELHIERVTVVAGTLTHLTWHIHVGQKVHFDLDRPVT